MMTGPIAHLCTHLPGLSHGAVANLIFPLPVQIVRGNIQAPRQVVGVFISANDLKISWRPQLYWEKRRSRTDTSTVSVQNRTPLQSSVQQ